MATELLHRELTYYLRGLGFQIHTALGGGHAERDYENALAYALESDSVPFLRQPVFTVNYRGREVGVYRPDFVMADGKLLLELKATPRIEPLAKGQTLSYLGVTGAELGLIMNFGGSSMQFERLPNFLTSRERRYKPAPPSGELLYPELSAAVLDALFEVYDYLGPGFLHQVYRRSAQIELLERGITVEYLKELPLRFRGSVLSTKSTHLFHIDDKLLLAVVAMKGVLSTDTERLRWAMRTVGARLGLIANFYPSSLDVRFFRQQE